MRILQIIDTLDAGGAERMAVNIANLLQSKNVDTSLVVSYHSGKLSEYVHPNIPLTILNKRNAYDLRAFYKLIKLVHNNTPSHIHAHSTSIIWAVGIKLLFPSISLIWHDHFGLDTKHKPRKYMKWLALFINHIICVKTELVNWAENNLVTESIIYMPNFSNLNIKNTHKVNGSILCIANIRRQKDLANLINAAEILVSRNIHFHIKIIGETVDRPYLEELNILIRQKELQQYITYCGPTADVETELASAEIGVLSSLTEGLPVAILEYGIAALPVVSTNVGECKNIIVNNEHGLLVNPGESISFADALEYMLQHKEEALNMGKKLNKRIINEYGENTFFKLYSELLKD